MCCKMILFLNLYIIISIISLSKGSTFWAGHPQWTDEIESNKIYLITPNYKLSSDSFTISEPDSIGNELIGVFVKMCSIYYDIVPVPVDELYRRENIQNLANQGLKVIDLSYPDHIMNNERIVYAGDIITEAYVHMINFTNLSNNGHDKIENKKPQTTWKTDIAAVNIAKIMSKKASKVNAGDLLDFVTKMDYTKDGVKTRNTCMEVSFKEIDMPMVLVCLDIDTKIFKHEIVYVTLNIHFVTITQCNESIAKFQNYLLAVLAPKPFEMDTESQVPTIFYESHYLNSEDESLFPHSTNLVSGLLIKHVFVKLIDDYGWHRVAIVSDDMPFSIKLEDELTQLFNEKGIVYNVQRCEKNQCDLNEALNNLRSMRARIVIANVGQEYATFINNHNLGPNKFTILYRVPPFKAEWYHLFITLSPEHRDMDLVCGVGNPLCNAILQGLTIVKDTYEQMKNLRLLHSKSLFYSMFTEMLIKKIQDPKATAYVHTASGKLLSSMNLHNTGITSQSTYATPYKIPPDNFEGCFVKTNNFVKYCGIDLVLILMLVTVLFVIIVLTISCYFHRTSPINAIRYQQF